MRRGLYPALTIAACTAALFPGVPALAEANEETIERGGVTIQFRRDAATAAWPFAVPAEPERGKSRFDLDGDGLDEVVTGISVTPDNNPDSRYRALLVRYPDGRAERLVSTDQRFATALSVADFNGDGYGDLAINGKTGVWTINGSADGLVPASTIRLAGTDGNQAVADFNADGYADLAVGRPFQTVGSKTDAGEVLMLSGGTDGLSDARAMRLTQDSAGVPGTADTSDLFGGSLAAGDVTGDSHPDLVVGGAADGVEDTGTVTVLPGGGSGVTGVGSSMVVGNKLDNPALHVRTLGAAVEVAEVTGDGRADVIVGAQSSTMAGRTESGVAMVLPGSTTGISADRHTIWHRNSPGLPGDQGTFNLFGSEVTAGDLTGDGRPDLVLAAWRSGTVTVLPSGPHGVSADGDTTLGGGGYFGGQIQALELSGAGVNEMLVTGTNRLQLYSGTDAMSQLGSDFFGATDLGTVNMGGALPRGMPLPVPAASTPPTPTTPPLAQPRSRFDFDGDGRDEVVVGNTDGAIIRYSRSGRLDALDPDWVYIGTHMSFAAGDFNGDGYADLAAGDKGDRRDNPALTGQGAVWVSYGGPSGLDYDRAQFFGQNTAGVPGDSESNDWFGAAVAAGDVNGDGRADLAIGAPGEGVGAAAGAGGVTVLYGSANGITTANAKWFGQSDSWIPGDAERDDHFGSALAIGDVTGDKRGDVAVAADHENTGIGMITLVKGGTAGVATTGATSVVYSELKLNMNSGAGFGAALAVADVTRDGKAEVLAGAPQAAVGGTLGGGLVVSFTGTASGISKTAFKTVHQDTPGVPGAAENGDMFGDAIAAGDVTGDGYPDLLVGGRGEAVGSIRWAGMVALLPGGASGITGTGSATFDQSQEAVPGGAEAFDEFGSSVSILNRDGTGGLDAMVGSWQEHITSATNQTAEGSVTEFMAGGGTLVPTGTYHPALIESTYGFGGSLSLGREMLAN